MRWLLMVSNFGLSVADWWSRLLTSSSRLSVLLGLKNCFDEARYSPNVKAVVVTGDS